MSEITISRLTRRYGGVAAVDGIDLVVREGEFLSLLGPSGCGKTTTLRCVAGLEPPDAGRITIGGAVMADGERGLSIPPNKRHLGMVFQSYALWPHMRVFGNVAYPLRVRRVPRGEIRDRVRAALHLVGLEELHERATSELSGGQQQRVALARALVSKPRVLLLDEPLSNLDSSLRAYMRRELRRIHREIRTTTVYVTHDQLEAATLSDRVVVMNRGRIEQIGTPREIFGAPANRWVAEFVGYDNFIEGEVAQVSGAALSVRPRGWPVALTCGVVDRARRFPAGAGVTLAIRGGSFRGDAGPETSALKAQVVDAMYVGDLTEYVLDAYGTRLVARLDERASGAAGGRLELGAAVELFVAPDQIVVLAA
jgi:iron(III) transport system ATP-binding protein